MPNLIVTIPKSKFKSYAIAERVLLRCDGVTNWGADGNEMMWFIRLPRLPKKPVKDCVCLMVYDGKIRGYFHILSVDPISVWEAEGYEFYDHKASQYVVAMANYVPLQPGQQIERKGFQGWRYTHLRPEIM